MSRFSRPLASPKVSRAKRNLWSREARFARPKVKRSGLLAARVRANHRKKECITFVSLLFTKGVASPALPASRDIKMSFRATKGVASSALPASRDIKMSFRATKGVASRSSPKVSLRVRSERKRKKEEKLAPRFAREAIPSVTGDSCFEAKPHFQ